MLILIGGSYGSFEMLEGKKLLLDNPFILEQIVILKYYNNLKVGTHRINKWTN